MKRKHTKRSRKTKVLYQRGRYLCIDSSCNRRFKNAGARGMHWKAAHYVQPPRFTPPETKHRSFADLVRNSPGWGREYRVHGKINPTDNDLIMGCLFLLVELNREIIRELKRSRTLS